MVERGRVASTNPASGSPTRLGGAHAAKAAVPRSRRQRLPSPPGVMSADVALDVREQRELAGALDRGRELTLVARAHPRQPTRQELAALGEESAEGAIPHRARQDPAESVVGD